MMLVIDATAAAETVLILADQGRPVRRRVFRRAFHETERLLPAIAALLRAGRTRPDQLTGIGVVRGPGSFTAVRLAVAVANAFGYALRIPVVGVRTGECATPSALLNVLSRKASSVRTGEFVTPEYGQPPTITQPRTKKR